MKYYKVGYVTTCCSSSLPLLASHKYITHLYSTVVFIKTFYVLKKLQYEWEVGFILARSTKQKPVVFPLPSVKAYKYEHFPTHIELLFIKKPQRPALHSMPAMVDFKMKPAEKFILYSFFENPAVRQPSRTRQLHSPADSSIAEE